MEKGENTMRKRKHLGTILSLIGAVAIYWMATSCSTMVGVSRAMPEIKFAAEIIKASKLHGVHPALITAVIHAESNFNPIARSFAGAKGLMQINAPTQKFLRLKNVYDPLGNIEAGTRYLKTLLEKFDGNISLALAAYNAGPGAVARYKGIPPYSETKNYVKKVLSYFNQYMQEFTPGPLSS